MGDSETGMDATQEILLRLREQEFASWRQIMTMSGGSIGFPATLLATGNLPDIHIGVLMLSWLMFIINIAIGAALIRDIIHWNIQLTWSKSDKRNAERNIERLNQIESHESLLTSDPLSNPYMRMSTPEEYEAYKKRMQKWYKISSETAKQSEKILTKRIIGIFMWLFYFSFILGYIFLASSFVIPKLLS